MKSLTKKQYAIIAHVKAFGMITKKVADVTLKPYYVSDHSKYVSAVLRSLIVTHKLLERQGRGVYIMRKAFLADDPDQLALSILMLKKAVGFQMEKVLVILMISNV